MLQLQALAPEDQLWEPAVRALRPELDAHALAADRDGARCLPGRVAYDPSQDAHNFRRIAESDLLQGYVIERVDGPPDAAGPAPSSVLMRTRVAYRVFRGSSDDQEPQPLRVFLERPLPRRPQPGHRIHAESGLARNSDLMAAVGEWRTWIVLDEDAAGAAA